MKGKLEFFFQRERGILSLLHLSRLEKSVYDDAKGI
jgi:hypothetical protein